MSFRHFVQSTWFPSRVKKINSGIFYGFSQVGKFITVYPKKPEYSIYIANKLSQITEGFPCPVIPYDLPLQRGGCIYYRYGSFSSLEIKNSDGINVPAIRDPQGRLIPDRRGPGAAIPSWESDPFVKQGGGSDNVSVDKSLLKTTIRAYEALSQRGKGGVYRALDLSVIPARLCALKEGRRNGESDWDGRDGYWRVQHEAHVISVLLAEGIEVSRVYSTFQEEGNYYLVTEFIEGESLQTYLLNQRKRLSIEQALQYGFQIAKLLNKIHSSGWVWRDCKPSNLIVTKKGTLRPIDFEGACPVDQPDPTPWGTTGYVPPEWVEEPITRSRIPEDLYALGVVLHQLLSGRTPDRIYPLLPLGKLRRYVPLHIRQMISALLNPDPHSRPDSSTVAQLLDQACAEDRQNKRAFQAPRRR